MEQCPLCNTERVSGDDYCKCGYEFSSTEPEPQPDLDSLKPNPDADWPEGPKSELQSDEDWIKEHGQHKDSALQTDEQLAENQDSRIRTDPQQEKQESSYEASVTDDISHYYIEDGVTSVQEKASANGTKVNGKDITGQGKVELENGNVIELSRIVECTFQIDSDGKGRTILPNNAEIFFEDNPITIGRNNFLDFMNSMNLDPFEISRKQFTISRE